MPASKAIVTLEQFVREFESIAYSAGKYKQDVFRDWLQMIVCSLAMQTQEELYLKTIKHYAEKDKRLVERLAQLFGALVLAMEGRRDMLGDLFMEIASQDRAGQFFTPMEVCRLMAQMTGVPAEGSPSVSDPACGSGRCLLAVAEINPRCVLVGTDIDHTCVQMLAVNLALNGLRGYAVHGNTLTNEVWRVYKIGMPGFPGVIYQVSYSFMCSQLSKGNGHASEENRTVDMGLQAMDAGNRRPLVKRRPQERLFAGSAVDQDGTRRRDSKVRVPSGTVSSVSEPHAEEGPLHQEYVTLHQPLLFEINHVHDTRRKEDQGDRGNDQPVQKPRHRNKAH